MRRIRYNILQISDSLINVGVGLILIIDVFSQSFYIFSITIVCFISDSLVFNSIILRGFELSQWKFHMGNLLFVGRHGSVLFLESIIWISHMEAFGGFISPFVKYNFRFIKFSLRFYFYLLLFVGGL